MKLEDLGWNEHFQAQLADSDPGLLPARVWRQDINQYHLLTADGDCTAVLPGRFRNEIISKAQLPTVGDWVLLSGEPGSLVVQRLLDRFSKFSRKEAGDTVDEQVVAANIDYAFVVTGLDDNFNANRIERYLLLARHSQSTPIIILNKADLCDHVQAYIAELQSFAMDTPIHILTALERDSVEQLREYLGPGKTGALLGSSGVGKSTITNALLGYEHLETGDVREGDSKGRHTTTYREMCVLPGGGLLIDTPGMREIQMWADETAVSEAFSDVEEILLRCRFSDCKHNSEPGCAVQGAIEDGSLDIERLDSYQRFQRELAHLEEKYDAGARAQKRKSRRKFAKLIKNRVDKRDP